ncbi:hypothetical protein SDC9_168405 [bioreactor metagenome]|uniref:Uncharacterized protein n=1 Tax=bioreactor metagenome TaxID=1076179 RepID=A0A645G4G1_9ZZZZ
MATVDEVERVVAAASIEVVVGRAVGERVVAASTRNAFDVDERVGAVARRLRTCQRKIDGQW